MADNPIRLWPNITRVQQAQLAVRMSGLPVFLVGVSYCLQGILSPYGMFAWNILGGLALVCLGFLIRAGVVAVAPWAAALVLILLANWWITLAQVTPIVFFALFTPIGWAIFAFQICVTIILTLFALSGLRGWWWLRRNRTEAT